MSPTLVTSVSVTSGTQLRVCYHSDPVAPAVPRPRKMPGFRNRETNPTMSTIDYAKARELMVEQQVRPWDVLDPRVLDVLAAMPREAFVPAAHRTLAYADVPLPLGHGEVDDEAGGRRPRAAGARPAAGRRRAGNRHRQRLPHRLPGRLAREVVSIERHADLADAARARLAAQGLGGNVRIDHRRRLRLRHRSPLRRDLRDRRGRRRSPPRFLRLAAARRPHVRRPRPLAGDGSGAGCATTSTVRASNRCSKPISPTSSARPPRRRFEF